MRRSIVNRQWAMMWALLCCCFITATAFSQKVSTLISKDKIVLGEQLFVKIRIEGITPAQVQQDFSFPDTLNHLEIISDSIEEADNSTIIHTLRITSFDSGYWELPSFKMVLTDQRILSTQPVNITVMPVDISDMQDYHEIKDIIEVTPENNWWIIASIVALALISLFSMLWFMNGKASIPEATKVTAAGLQQLYNSTIQQLDSLQPTDITRREEVIRLFAETAQLVRNFIDASHQQDTTHLTTGEYMLKEKGKLPDADTETSYFQFLRLADAVKFAKYFPPVEETNAIFPILRNVVTEVFHQVKPVS